MISTVSIPHCPPPSAPAQHTMELIINAIILFFLREGRPDSKTGNGPHTHTHRRRRVNPVETVLFKFGTGLGQKLFTIVSIWIRFLDFIAHRRPAGRQTDVQAGAELGTLPPTDLIAVTVCGDGKLSKGKFGEIRDGTLFFLIIDCEGNDWDSDLKALKFMVSVERNSNLVILYDYSCWKNQH